MKVVGDEGGAHSFYEFQDVSLAKLTDQVLREAKLDGASEHETLCAVIDQVRSETEAI